LKKNLRFPFEVQRTAAKTDTPSLLLFLLSAAVAVRDVKASRPEFGLGLGLELLVSASKLSGLGLEVLASASRHSGHYCKSSQLPEPGTENRPSNFCATSPTSILTLPTTLRLNWQNSIATFQCCSPYLIDCFASRQALLQSREFSRRAV